MSVSNIYEVETYGPPRFLAHQLSIYLMGSMPRCFETCKVVLWLPRAHAYPLGICTQACMPMQKLEAKAYRIRVEMLISKSKL